MIEITNQLKFPHGLQNLTLHPGLLYNFFNFYINGELPSGSFPRQVIYPIIVNLITEDSGEDMYFFPQNIMAKEGFFRPASLPGPGLKLLEVPKGNGSDYSLHHLILGNNLPHLLRCI